MNITFHQLKVLTAISTYQSVTKASEAMNMTQPAVSIQLKNLQEQFEVPLTEIIGKKIFLTEFGKELVECSERIIEELNQIEYKMQQLKGLLAGKIRISSVSTGKYIIPYLMADFMRFHPDIDITLEVSNRQTVLSHLQQNSTDLALLSILPDDLEVDSITLNENLWFLACAPAKAPYYQAEINKGNWQNVPFVLREKGSGTRVMMERFFQNRKISALSKMELETNEAIKQALMAGLGASILSVFSIRQEIKDQRIKLLDFPGLPLKADWKLVWLKQKKLTPATEAFLKWVNENRDSVFQSHFLPLQ